MILINIPEIKIHAKVWCCYVVFCVFFISAATAAIADQGDDVNLMSFHLQDISVRSALQQVAKYQNMNLVISDAVSGELSIHLEDVSWQHAFEAILILKGLDKKVINNIVLVAPKAELYSQKNQTLEQAKLTSQLSELKYEFINLSYATADEVADLIKGDGNDSRILSSRGSVNLDKRTNRLLIKDTEKNIQIIRQLVDSIDIPVKQVQIEARIVSVNEGQLEELGVRWGVTATKDDYKIGGSIEGNNEDLTETNLEDFLNVNLGLTSNNASRIAFQVLKLNKGILLDLELSALQAESKAEIISSPRLMTTNKTPAYIEQGTEIPYLEAASSGATSISFKKAVLSLTVTPQVTSDNHIILDLLISQDRPGDVVKSGVGEAVAIDTQRLATQVLVKNEETIVLGGVFHHSVIKTTDKVPLLGDLPVLGVLFKRNYEKVAKQELLIFVTPKVVNP